MTMRKDFETLLCPVIEHHLPSAGQSGFREWPPHMGEGESRSANYALHIAMAHSMGPSAFGLTDADVTLTDARRSLAETQRLLQGLSSVHRMRISILTSPSAKLIERESNISDLEDALMCAWMDAAKRKARGEGTGRLAPHDVAVELLGREHLTKPERQLVAETVNGQWGLETLEELLGDVLRILPALEKEYRSLERASRKPNWRAAAVAGECRHVWGKEHCEAETVAWEQHRTGKGRGLNERQQIFNFAPVSQNHDAPGPFGRFVADVLGALKITTEAGEPVSAAVALKQWRKMRGQNPN